VVVGDEDAAIIDWHGSTGYAKNQSELQKVPYILVKDNKVV
jgi:hypothetical protein